MPTAPLRERPAWKALEQHYAEIAGVHLSQLFADDPGRGERLTAEAAGLYLDYSKNRVTDETLRLLVQLAEESGVAERRDALSRGDRAAVSENRSVVSVVARVPRLLDGMPPLAQRILRGEWKDSTGKPILIMINVGIVGSDLGFL